MGIREADCERNYARAASGTPAVKASRSHAAGDRGNKKNFIAGIDFEGVLDCTFFKDGNVNGLCFEAWCEEMLIPTIKAKYPLGGMTVVMDNARCVRCLRFNPKSSFHSPISTHLFVFNWSRSFHRRRFLVPMFQNAQIGLKFLPAYSPEYTLSKRVSRGLNSRCVLPRTRPRGTLSPPRLPPLPPCAPG